MYLFGLSAAFAWLIFPHPPLLPLVPWNGSFAGHLTVFGLAISLATWVVYFRLSGVSRLIQLLGEKLKSGLEDRDAISPDHLKDLLFIGEYCEAGGEKNQVIDLLVELIPPRSRSGDVYLESVLRKAVNIVINPAQPGNEENYFGLLALATSIIDGRQDTNQAGHKLANLVWELIRRLGVEAVRTQPRTVCHQFLKASAGNAVVLFEIGEAALASNRHRVVQDTLHRLEILGEKAGLAQNDETRALLSFLAYLSHSESKSMSSLALSYLELRQIHFSPSRKKCLLHTLSLETRFDTQDALRELYQTLYKKEPPAA